jgi:hypothetical protein
MISASELTKERASLLVRIEEINAALALLETPCKAVEISTRRNLQNTYMPGVTVYASKKLMTLVNESSHEGWITAEDAATLRTEYTDDIEGGYITVYD